MTEFKGTEKFESKFNIWKNNLLDMSHRNRQLYFKPEGRNTLEIIHPTMQKLFDEMIIKQKKFIFPPVFEPTFFKSEMTETEEDFKKRLKEIHWQKIREKIKNDNKTELITKVSDKLLEKLIKKLRHRTKNSIDEQGVNILFITFGLFKWFEDEKKKEPIYSPLLFVPINITRKRVIDDFYAEIIDDEVILNPSLKEKFKTIYNIDLPEFPEEFHSETIFDYFGQVQHIAEKVEGWTIFERSFIGLFSFAKLRMYNDLLEYKEKIYNHKIIKSIAEGQGFVEDSSHIPEEKEYTDDAKPIESYHILDCDSSQFKAITYAKKGASLVIRGPPGTGKSQAISNIIAECLSAGKKVLFVAEKMAALDVVKKRLDKCGVGEFCLELHSQKSNKVEVLKQLNRSLGCELNKRMFSKIKYKNLRNQRLKLDDYVNNVHVPIDGSSTIYNKVGEYQKFNDLPLIDAEIRRPLEFNEESMFEIEDYFERLDGFRDVLEHYDEHPWFGTNFASYEDDLRDTLYDNLLSLLDYCKKIQEDLAGFEKKYNIKLILDHDTLKEFIEFFNSYNYKALKLDPKEFQKFGSFVKVFDNAYHSSKKELSKSVKSNNKLPLLQNAEIIDEFQQKYLNDPKPKTFNGIEQDLDKILDHDDKIEQDKVGLHNLLKINKININSRNTEANSEVITEWKNLEFSAKYWLDRMNSFNEWLTVQIVLQKLTEFGIDQFINQLKNKTIPDIPLFDLFKKTFSYSWIRAGMAKFPNLGSFSLKYQRKTREKFIKLDDECVKTNRYRLCEKLFDVRPSQFWLSNGIKSSEYSILLREMAKQRNVKPLRTIIPLTKNFITKIKPCFMMSPLSVSQYLPADEFTEYFDIVVFDEASQICPEDAIGAILRGKQLIVVGDEKQLPPTRFFSASLYDSVDDMPENVDVFDSILEECTGVGFPVVMLNYHYRSRKEGLIAFSNYYFYDNNLITFPDPLRKGKNGNANTDSLPAIEFNLVENSTYDKGRSRKNKIEAGIVANHIVEHYKNNKENGTSYSLGIIAFSEAQQTAIMNSLEKIYKDDPDLETLVKNYDEEPLFIKNLENVQGDERDYIFFSIGYGKDKDGNISLNFGPLNKTGGERRLNVAITRARYHVKIFCSFLPNEVDLSKTSSAGVHRMIEYLEFARTNQFPDISTDKALSIQFPPGPLVQSVKSALEQKGYTIDLRIGRSKFQIDLAIENPEDDTKYILAVELDGGSYYLTKSARDRDRTRQIILKSLGWNLYHIWTPQWFTDRNSTLTEIESIIKESISIEKQKAKKISESASSTSDTGLAIDTENNSVTTQETLRESSENELPNVKYNVKEFEADQTPSNQEKSTADFRKQYLNFPGVQEYQEFTGKNIIPPEEFNKKTNRMKAVKEIIKIEGPIHKDLLQTRIKDYFSLSRMNSSLQEKMNDILNSIPNTNEFYFPKKYDTNLIRIEVNKNDDPRKFEYISDLELKNAMKLMIRKALSLDKDELFLRTLQLFGIPARRPEYIPRLDGILKDLIIFKDISRDSVRNFDFTLTEADKLKIASEEARMELNDEELDKLIDEAEKLDTEESMKISPEEKEKYDKIITRENILDIMENGLPYSFDDLIHEFDIEDEQGVQILAYKLKDLMRNKEIESFEKNGEIYWTVKLE